jgi:hypothetical protein
MKNREGVHLYKTKEQILAVLERYGPEQNKFIQIAIRKDFPPPYGSAALYNRAFLQLRNEGKITITGTYPVYKYHLQERGPMPKEEEPSTQLKDLNLEQLRQDIYLQIAQKLVPLIAPLIRELDQLAIVHSFMSKQPSPEPRPEIPEKKETRRVLTGPYAAKPQTVAILDILHKNPGSTAPEITKTLLDGGYPFPHDNFNNNAQSVYAALRRMIVDTGKVEKSFAAYKGGRGAATGKILRYWIKGEMKSHPVTPLPEGDYSQLNQRESILLTLQKEPGLAAAQLVDKLEKGGYQWHGPDHRGGVTGTLRYLREEGLIRVDEFHQYYLSDKKAQKPEKEKRKPVIISGLNEAVIKILEAGPRSGMSRQEVFQEIEAREKEFPSNSKHRFSYRITWALNGLVRDNRLIKTGLKTDAIFSIPKKSTAERRKSLQAGKLKFEQINTQLEKESEANQEPQN